MKEYFRSKTGYNTAIITCKNTNKTFDLHYHLYDNPIQHIWQTIHLKNFEGFRSLNFNSITVETLKKELTECCIEENVDVPQAINQDFLNKLHNDYVWSNHNVVWEKINHLIHFIERKLDNKFSDYDSTLTFYANKDYHVPILEEYKIFLNTDVKWGSLNLGYGTLGKDYVNIAKNNDNLDDLAIKSTITSETVMSFCVEPGIINTDAIRFYHWVNDCEFEIPKNDLNKLSLGHYSLGQIIITDELLKFHNNTSDWYVPNHKCKLLWNKEVFSNIEILNVNFENTDMLFESFIDHTGSKDLLNV